MLAASLHRSYAFQTDSVPGAGYVGFGLVPGLSLLNDVPPTLVTVTVTPNVAVWELPPVIVKPLRTAVELVPLAVTTW